MANFVEIPLPEENPLNIVVEVDTPVKASRGRKKKATNNDAEDSVE